LQKADWFQQNIKPQDNCEVASFPTCDKLLKEQNFGKEHLQSEQGVCQLHCGLAIYMKKYLKTKEELWKLKYFSPCKNILIFQKLNPRKETKILQDIVITP
jgi:hypothetical protein